MASDLGEVRVRIEQEGAEEAADRIGEATGTGNNQNNSVGPGGAAFAGAEAGELLGGISTKLAGILGLVGFLATLKPIQELLSGIQRLFSVAILPLISLLTAFLRPLLQKILRFIGGLDFNNLISSLVLSLEKVFNRLITQVSDSIASQVPGVNSSGVSDSVKTGLSTASQAVGGTGTGLGPAFNPVFNLSLDWLKEQSNSSLDSNIADKTSESNNQGLGGQ